MLENRKSLSELNLLAKLVLEGNVKHQGKTFYCSCGEGLVGGVSFGERDSLNGPRELDEIVKWTGEVSPRFEDFRCATALCKRVTLEAVVGYIDCTPTSHDEDND